jgi:DNA-directed RNA polymerase subunit RPC12/RpoP
MWIRLDCPNGHPVKVEEKYAGRMGRCPMCGVKVLIPKPEQVDLSEDAILDILGPSASVPAPARAPEPAAVGKEESQGAPALVTGGSSALGTSVALGQPTRICPSCKRRVSVRYQICPHCRTYMPIADASSEKAAHPTTTNCPHCGVRSFPGATVCNNCGESL